MPSNPGAQRVGAVSSSTSDASRRTTRLGLVDDVTGPGNNRRLSPILGFPAMTVPAGFTTDGLPVGIEFMGRPYAEATLFKFGYAYEQKTHHRKPPASTPALRGEP